MKKILLLVAFLITIFASASLAQAQSASTNDYKDFVVKEVAVIHGGNGPFAVAGYRMGARALSELDLLKGSFDLDAAHESLPEVGWTCIADGIQAATGASVGKMTLKLIQVNDKKEIKSVIANKRTGEKIIFRLTDSYLQKFGGVPYEQLNEQGRIAAALKDEDIFEMQIVGGEKPKKMTPFERQKVERKAKTRN